MGDYYSSSTISDQEIAEMRLKLWGIIVAVEIIGCFVIYGLIYCCCPTSLKRVRQGFVFSDNTNTWSQPQFQAPVALVNHASPMAPASGRPLTTYPPQYAASQPQVEIATFSPTDEACRNPLLRDSH